jgi:replication factor C subunit 3/5
VVELLKRLDDQLKGEVVALGAQYEHRCVQGQKAIFHLEAFTAKFMAAYKAWTISLFA